MGANVMEKDEYFFLKDLKLEIKGQEENGSFSFCFWVYLQNPTSFPSVLIYQVVFFAFSAIPSVGLYVHILN